MRSLRPGSRSAPLQPSQMPWLARAPAQRRDQAADLAPRSPVRRRGQPVRRDDQLRRRRRPAAGARSRVVGSLTPARPRAQSTSQRRKRCAAAIDGTRRSACVRRGALGDEHADIALAQADEHVLVGDVVADREQPASPAARGCAATRARSPCARRDDGPRAARRRAAARASVASRATRRRSTSAAAAIARVHRVRDAPPVQGTPSSSCARRARRDGATRAAATSASISSSCGHRRQRGIPAPARRTATRRARRANAMCGSLAARSSTRSRGRPEITPSVTPGAFDERVEQRRACRRRARASCGVGANGTSVPSRSTAATSVVAVPSCCQSAGMRKP